MEAPWFKQLYVNEDDTTLVDTWFLCHYYLVKLYVEENVLMRVQHYYTGGIAID